MSTIDNLNNYDKVSTKTTRKDRMSRLHQIKEDSVSKLRELKQEQERLREHVFNAYKESGLSIVNFSKQLGIPYGTLRRIMDGKEMGYKNILKLIHWWESR